MIDVTKRIKDGFLRQVARHKESKAYKAQVVKKNKLAVEIQKLRDEITIKGAT